MIETCSCGVMLCRFQCDIAHACIHILAWDEYCDTLCLYNSVIISLINIKFCGYMNFLWYAQMFLVNADPEVLFNRSADLGSIAVDWVNNELYWVEIQLGYRVC